MRQDKQDQYYKTMKDELPNKPSELIELALSDMNKCIADDRYKINFNHYHIPNRILNQFNDVIIKEPICSVCFAGSVMAKSMNTQPDTYMHVYRLTKDQAKKLYALDLFRQGLINDGLVHMGYDEDDIKDIKDIKVEQNALKGFTEDMNKIISTLKSHDL